MMSRLRWFTFSLVCVLIAVGAPVLGQGQLSVQVLQLLSRVNTWTATQTHQDLRLANQAIPVTTTYRIYADTLGNLYWNGSLIAGSGSANNHNLLSTTHPDTVPASPVRGDIIVANSTPAWTKLARCTSGSYIGSNGTDTVCATSAASFTSIPAAQLTGTSAAIDGNAITNLNATNLGTGTVPLARLSNIANAQIAAAAGIVYSKLTLTGSIVNGDLVAGTLTNAAINAAAAIAYSKLNLATSILFSDWALNGCVANQIAKVNAGGTAWACAADANSGGTVTSVAMTVPAQFAIGGSPVTSTGTLSLTLANQAANIVFAGPSSGGATAPTFRALVNADFPLSGAAASTYTKVTVNTQGIVTAGATGNLSSDFTGTLGRANGGTGLTTATNNNTIIGNGAAWVSTNIPDCVGGALGFTQASNTFGCVTTATNRLANVASTGNTASIVTTNLKAAASAGLYRVNVYILNTQAASTSGSTFATIGWNDGTAAQTATTSNITNTLANVVQQSFVLRSAAAQNITYSTTYASVGGTVLTYSIYITLEAL